MTKQQILLKINDVDHRILELAEHGDQLDWRKIKKLKKAELERLLDAFETLYEMFSKLRKENKDGSEDRD